jgi:hypothetical protein
MFTLRRSLPASVRPVISHRTFIATPTSYKTVTETVKETAEKAHRAVSDAVLGGIETGEAVTEKVKEKTKPLAEKIKDVRRSLLSSAHALKGRKTGGEGIETLTPRLRFARRRSPATPRRRLPRRARTRATLPRRLLQTFRLRLPKSREFRYFSLRGGIADVGSLGLLS